MKKLFISYRRKDDVFTGRIYDRLKTKFGASQIFKDVDNIPLGKDFREVLATEVQACDVVLVVISSGWADQTDGDGQRRLDMPRDFVRTEIELALERDIPVVPILLGGAVMPSAEELPDSIADLAYRHAARVRSDPDFDTDMQRLCAQIESGGSALVPNPVSEKCPYRGLKAFGIDDADVYFGREDVIELALKKIGDFKSEDSLRFLAIIGASGSGKSSLAYAGILASLTKGATSEWPIVDCRPGHDPIENLAIALGANPQTASAVKDVGDLMQRLKDDPHRLHLTSRLILEGRPAETQLVLLVDQFEELFRPGSPEIKQAFIENLLDAASSPDGKTIVLLTMRADFYAKAAAYPSLANALSTNQVLVGPMTKSQIRTTIEQPAAIAGLRIETGLADLLVADSKKNAGALPFLQDALTQLWERQQNGMLTIADYDAIGRLDGAIETRANEFFRKLSPTEQEECRRLFLRLTQPGEGTEDTKRRIRRSELDDNEAVDNIINKLARARLITVESDRDSENGAPHIDVAHEALIRGWPRLKTWIDEVRDSLRLHHEISRDASNWSTNRDDAFLYRGTRLGLAEEWLSRTSIPPTETEKKFVTASIAFREEDRRMRRRTTKRLRALAVSAGIAAAVAIGLAISANNAKNREQQQREFAIEQTKLAVQQTRVADANRLATEARELVNNKRLSEAVVVAADAVETVLKNGLVNDADSRHPLETLDATLDAVDRRDKLLTLGARPQILEPVLSPIKNWLVTQSYDRVTYLWHFPANDRPTKSEISSLGGEIESVSFSPDDRWLLVADTEGRLTLHDLATNRTTELLHNESRLVAARFDPKSRWLMSSDSNSVRLWNLSTYRDATVMKPMRVFRNAKSGTRPRGDFSPDGSSFVLNDAEGISVWEIENLENGPPKIVKNSYRAVTQPIGEQYAITEQDGEYAYKFISSSSPTQANRFTFSSDGRLLLTLHDEERKTPSGSNKTVTLTDLVDITSADAAVIRVVAAEMRVGVFSAEGNRIAVSDGRYSTAVFDVGLKEVHPVKTIRGDFTDLAFVGKHYLFAADRYGDSFVVSLDGRRSDVVSQSRRIGRGGITTISPRMSRNSRWYIDASRQVVDLRKDDPWKSPFSILRNLSSEKITFTPDNEWLVIADTESLYFWDAQGTQPFTRVVRKRIGVGSNDAILAVLPRDEEIIVVSDWGIQLFEADPSRNWEAVAKFDAKQDTTSNYTVDRNQQLILRSHGSETYLIDFSEEQPTKRLLVGAPSTHTVACKNGTWAACATKSGKLMAIRLDTLRSVVVAESLDGITAIGFSDDGRYLYSASHNGLLHIWQTSEFENSAVVDAGTGGIFALATDPDGKWLATRSYNGVGRLRRLDEPSKIVAELREGIWVRARDQKIVESDFVRSEDWTSNLWNSILRTVSSNYASNSQQTQIYDLFGYSHDMFEPLRDDTAKTLVPHDKNGKLAEAPFMPQMVVRATASPDGERMVLAEPNGIFTCNIGGRDRKKLLRFGKDPAWCRKPGQNLIAFAAAEYGEEKIWVVDPDAQEARVVADGTWPTWSTSGQLFFRNRDGTLQRLDPTQSDSVAEDLLSIEHFYPSVSPDGRFVAHQLQPQKAHSNLRSELLDDFWRNPASTLAITDLNSKEVIYKFPFYGTDGMNCSWSPDGKYVAVGTYALGFDAAGIWIVDIESNTAAQLAKGSFNRPTWSADGQTVYFDSRAGLWSLPVSLATEWLEPKLVVKTMFEDYRKFLMEDAEPQPIAGTSTDDQNAVSTNLREKRPVVLMSFALGLSEYDLPQLSLEALKLIESAVAEMGDSVPEFTARYRAILAKSLSDSGHSQEHVDAQKNLGIEYLRRSRDLGLISASATEQDAFLKSLIAEKDYQALISENAASAEIAKAAFANGWRLTIVANGKTELVNDAASCPDEFAIVGLRAADAGDAVVPHLAAIAKLWSLEILDLTNCKVDDAGMAILSSLPNLRELRLDGSAISDAGLRSLTHMSKLRLLGLGATAISNSGLEHLASLRNLWILDLSDTGTTGEGLNTLLALDQLRQLGIRNIDVADDDVKSLFALPTLLEIDARGTTVSPANYEELSAEAERIRGTDVRLRFTRDFVAEGRLIALNLSAWANKDLAVSADGNVRLSKAFQSGFDGLHDVDVELLDVPFQIGERYVSSRHPFRENQNLAVGQKVNRLYFLQAADLIDSVPNGTPIGAYEVNYDDGEMTRIPLVIGDNLLDAREYPNADGSRSATNAQVAWRGVKGKSRNSKKSEDQILRLFVYGWNNPRPDATIQTIRLVRYRESTAETEDRTYRSFSSRRSESNGRNVVAAPFCVAVTASLSSGE